MSLIVCEFHEVDGAVRCDVVCSHCGGVAVHQAAREFVTGLVYANAVPICDDCASTQCKTCGKFPSEEADSVQWYNGVCWECRDTLHGALIQKLRTIAFSE